MRALLVFALLLGTAAALVPEADARQACTWGSGDPCDDHLVCVWDRVNAKWTCAGEMSCPMRCDEPWD